MPRLLSQFPPTGLLAMMSPPRVTMPSKSVYNAPPSPPSGAELPERVLLDTVSMLVTPLYIAPPRPSGAELPEKVLSDRVAAACGALAIAPPSTAEFLENVLVETVMVLLLAIAPPSTAELPEKELLDTVRDPRWLRTAPPFVAELPVKTLADTVVVPTLTIAPPPSLAELPEKVLPDTVTAPLLKIAPPSAAEPSTRVRELIAKLLPEFTRNSSVLFPPLKVIAADE